MLELIVIGLLMWGSYEHGQADSIHSCVKDPQVVVQCTDIQPPAGPSFGDTTRSYSDLVTQYRKCQKACTSE